MREIKFRIFDGKKMVDVGIIDIDSERSMDYYNWYDGYSGEDYKFDKYPLMQYTGLKDKNGKEIYEGDILADGCLIVWRDDLASFAIRKGGWMYDHYFGEAVDAEMCEVIGNKFENPDLINPT